MAGVGNTQLRKAFGVLKDSTKVGLAKVNSDYKELDVAIVKATNHVEDMAKEKHIRTIFDATVSSRPRADVAYCIQALARRLAKTQNWAVALKTLIVIHRALREADPTFRDELISYSRSRVRMLNVSHFKDDSSPNAWDYSAWVRSYALFLEEKLECYRILKYDVEAESSQTKGLNTTELLEQLPALQQLLFRLLSCKPEGAAVSNNVIQYALSIVAGESAKLFNAINDGTLNLVDKFFEMQQHDAVRALDIYKRAGHQAEMLSEFYEICKRIDHLREQKFMKVEQPPASFATAMEEYVKGAAHASPRHQIAGNEERSVTPQAVKAIEYKRSQDIQDPPEPSCVVPELAMSEHCEASASASALATPSASAVSYLTDDLLGLSELRKDASELDEKNALALAIVTDENEDQAANRAADWELALIAGSTSNGNAAVTNKLAGGFDRLTLDSLYDDALTRQTNSNGSYHTVQLASNPYTTSQYSQDPFYASNNVAPPANVQLAAMAQQQQAMMMGGQNALNPFGHPYGDTRMQSYQSHNPYSGFI
ncbi:putative clathrin assembly protein At5g35200 [Aristolochia californica]|uniref:putative clathrin assembly protein At5g35200 n=1 Tax=Aristolochia californica TaxID=171875 RepID=UPI0035DC9D34